MAGKIKTMIDEIVTQRAKGNPTIATTTKIKLSLKGVNTDVYTESSPDDPTIIKRLHSIAEEFGIKIN